MDKDTTIRAFVIASVIALATGLILMLLAFPGAHRLAEQLGSWNQTHFQPIYDGAVEDVIAAAAVAFFLFNIRSVLDFLRLSLARTDALIIGDWHVYCYTKTQGEVMLLRDLWTIGRTLSRQYAVSIMSLNKDRKLAHEGSLVCNERDRFSILLEGADHKEQSLVCFVPRIPAGRDSRTLGLGVGDDADYFLSARVYLASRRDLPEEGVRAVLDDASRSIRNGSQEQLIQLSPSLISEIMLRNPMPPDLLKTEEEASPWRRLWAICLRKMRIGIGAQGAKSLDF